MTNTVPHIVLVEDSPHDRHLIRECLQDAEIEVDFTEIKDGEQAVHFFQRTDEDDFDIVLLDVKLPRKDGYQVLDFIRETPGIDDKPVVIMTAFHPPTPVFKQKHRADVFWNKPVDLDGYDRLVKIIKELLQKSTTHE